MNDFIITLTVQRAIKKTISLNRELSEINKMDDRVFFDFMGGRLSYEYLRTGFDSKTLTPVNDFFLFSFIYRGQCYEVELLREPYEDTFSFPYADFVNKAGYWHSTFPAAYSYRDYIAGKPIK